MGPLGKVGTHDRPLEIRGQKYVSNVNSRGQTPRLHPPPRTSRRHRDWGRPRTEGVRTFQDQAHLSTQAGLSLSFFVGNGILSKQIYFFLSSLPLLKSVSLSGSS